MIRNPAEHPERGGGGGGSVNILGASCRLHHRNHFKASHSKPRIKYNTSADTLLCAMSILSVSRMSFSTVLRLLSR